MTKTVRLRELQPGMIIAQNVYSKNLELLIEKNTALTAELIQRLDNWRVNQVDIIAADQAPATPDLAPAAAGEPAFAARYDEELRQGEVIRNESLAITRQLIDNIQAQLPLNRNLTRAIVDKLIGETVNNQRMLTTLLAVKHYDNYIFKHLLNVSVLAIMTGQCLELTQQEIHALGEAALLHDIGMTMVPREIWNKSGPLTTGERFQVQKHPIFSTDLLEQIPGVELEIRHAVYQHHEREDGSGYPKGLPGGKICLFAKIIAVADCYDAMINPRQYRPGKLPQHTIRELLQMSTTTLNREVMKVFVGRMSLYPVGSVVRLNTREIGITVTANRNAPLRPTIKVMRDATGAAPAAPAYLDLRKEKSLFIVENILEQSVIDALLQNPE